jgi:hypothetical protein
MDNGFVVNIPEGATSVKTALEGPRSQYTKQDTQQLTVVQQRNDGLQQIHMKSCQTIKRMKDKKKNTQTCSVSTQFTAVHSIVKDQCVTLAAPGVQ